MNQISLIENLGFYLCTWRMILQKVCTWSWKRGSHWLQLQLDQDQRVNFSQAPRSFRSINLLCKVAQALRSPSLIESKQDLGSQEPKLLWKWDLIPKAVYKHYISGLAPSFSLCECHQLPQNSPCRAPCCRVWFASGMWTSSSPPVPEGLMLFLPWCCFTDFPRLGPEWCWKSKRETRICTFGIWGSEGLSFRCTAISSVI